jgi:hypothetical protein
MLSTGSFPSPGTGRLDKDERKLRKIRESYVFASIWELARGKKDSSTSWRVGYKLAWLV